MTEDAQEDAAITKMVPNGWGVNSENKAKPREENNRRGGSFSGETNIRQSGFQKNLVLETSCWT